MDIPYSFLQRSANSQFKDLAFFQILKRKGPYIERSLTKIQNDLFYRHKIPGGQMKNLAFIKQIRLTLSAYEILVNQIRNDFMMTELDSLGDSIHQMFSQMITVVLKTQKLAIDQLREISLEQKKHKQMAMKQTQEQQKAKQIQQAEKEKNDRFKQIEQLKYNFKELLKLQVESDKDKEAMQKVWISIVEQTIAKAKQSTLIKDSQLQKIIKDSCEYMYKNHSQLDHIVRLTKQDILQAEKTIETFDDQARLLEENQKRICHMKQVARKLVNFVRQKAYDRTQAMVQTDLTQGDGSRGLITTKQLDEKRRTELKIRAYERQLKQKDQQINEIQLKLKQTQLRLKQAQQSSSSSQQQHQHENYSRSSKRSQDIKKRTFISRSSQSGSNIIPQKFSTNLLRNNNTKKRRPNQINVMKSQQQQKNTSNNSQQNLFKLNPKMSVRVNPKNQMNKQESIDKKSDTIVVMSKTGNKQISQSENVNNNNKQDKISRRLSTSTVNNKGTRKNFNNQRPSVLSQQKMKRASILVPPTMKLMSCQMQQCSKQNSVSQQSQLRQSQQQPVQQQAKIKPLINKKFYKVRNSYLVPQARSSQQISRTLLISNQRILANKGERDEEILNKGSESDENVKKQQYYSKKQNQSREYQSNDEDQSIDNKEANDQDYLVDRKILREKSENKSINKNRVSSADYLINSRLNQKIVYNKSSKSQLFTLNHALKVTIRPSLIKRYIQSTYNHPITQQKFLQTPLQSNPLQSNHYKQQSRFFKKIQKINKSTSYCDLSKKNHFQSLDMGDNFQTNKDNKRQKNMRLLAGDGKKKHNGSSFSVDVIKQKFLTTDSFHNINKQNIQQNVLFHAKKLSSPQLNSTSSIMRVKTQAIQKFQSQQRQQQGMAKSCIIKKPIDISVQNPKNQQKSNLKKSSAIGRNKSFYVVEMNGQKLKTVNLSELNND